MSLLQLFQRGGTELHTPALTRAQREEIGGFFWVSWWWGKSSDALRSEMQGSFPAEGSWAWTSAQGTVMSHGRVSQWLAVSRGTEPPGLAVANSDQRLLLGGGGWRGGAGSKVDNKTWRFPLSCLADNMPETGLCVIILYLSSEKKADSTMPASLDIMERI